MPTRDRRSKDGTIAIAPDLGRTSGPDIPRDHRVVMRVSTLVGLLDACVSNFDSDGMAELIDQLHECMPVLLRSSVEADFVLLVRAARLIAFSQHPEPVSLCVAVLLDVSFAHVARGRTVEAIPLVERALDLATDNNLRPQMRRACSVYAGMSTDLGIPARGVEYALRAVLLAQELNFPLGEASAFANMTAALNAMGLYRETVTLSLRVIQKFKGQNSFAEPVFVARSNLASAALSLRHFTLAAEAAKEACELLATPSNRHEALNRMATEIVWLKSAIELHDHESITARLSAIRFLAKTYPSPRSQLNEKIAEAAYDLYDGRSKDALATLNAVLERSKAVPGVYRDNLALLIKAYESEGDHTSALCYLGELVEFIAQTQVEAVRRHLEAVGARIQTPMQGKDDARTLVMAIQRATPIVNKNEEPSEAVYREALERLAVSAEVRVDAHGRRAYRVGKLVGLLAEALGAEPTTVIALERAARLYDIGKLGIPDGILMKPGPLSTAEYALMQRHTLIGAKILRQAGHPSFRLAETISLHHHERWDGSGYPHHMSGLNIPDAARMVSLADAYDALTHDRTYRPSLSHTQAVAELTRNAGIQFDPTMTDVFVALVDRLHDEYGEGVDAFLAVAGNDQGFIMARDKVSEMLGEIDPLMDGNLT